MHSGTMRSVALWRYTTSRPPDARQTGKQQPDHWQTRLAQAIPKTFYDCSGPAEATPPLRKRAAAAQTPRMRDATGGNGQPDAEGQLARLKQRSGYCGLCCCIIRDFTSHKSRRSACRAHQDSRVLNDEEWRALIAKRMLLGQHFGSRRQQCARCVYPVAGPLELRGPCPFPLSISGPHHFI